jgi:hypothetical protein
MKQPLLFYGCKISLTADNIIVTKNNKTILKGIRDTVSTLWMVPIKHHRKALLLAQDLPSVPYYMQQTVHTINQLLLN